MNDLGLDSLDQVEIIMRMEDEFGEFLHYFNSLLASRNFYHLLITFASSLSPDQDQQNVVPDLDSNHLKKVNFEKNQQTTIKVQKFPNIEN